jgi:hypothetical protein
VDLGEARGALDAHDRDRHLVLGRVQQGLGKDRLAAGEHDHGRKNASRSNDVPAQDPAARCRPT